MAYLLCILHISCPLCKTTEVEDNIYMIGNLGYGSMAGIWGLAKGRLERKTGEEAEKTLFERNMNFTLKAMVCP